MACSSCGARIRRLAKQYPYKDVKPVSLPSKQTVKASKKEGAKYSVVAEEQSEYTTTVEDLSTIHTV